MNKWVKYVRPMLKRLEKMELEGKGRKERWWIRITILTEAMLNETSYFGNNLIQKVFVELHRKEDGDLGILCLKNPNSQFR
jgi:hypothetical protein